MAKNTLHCSFCGRSRDEVKILIAGQEGPFEEPMLALRDATQTLRVEAEKNATGRILNPFRVFEPLSAEAGPELFRGREHAVHEIEDALADADNAVSLQLLAPRRAGKTSLLKMLPGMLPDPDRKSTRLNSSH